MKRLLLPVLLLLPVAFAAFTQADKNADRALALTTTADNYKSWPIYKSVRTQDDYNFKPELCGTFSTVQTDTIRFSDANATMSPHGQKLYKLYVKNLGQFTSAGNEKFFQSPGQTLVKEVWDVRVIPNDSTRYFRNARYHATDKKWYLPTKASQLFVMQKESVADTTNDGGWIYGVLDLPEKGGTATIVRQGLLSNCMGCHSGNKDRIFGPGK